jgi:hypothetical protein
MKCHSCNAKFEEFEDGTNQAYNCAALVHENLLKGSYGSIEIDMQIWQFSSRPSWVKDGNICDECIQQLKRNNNIYLIKDGIL